MAYNFREAKEIVRTEIIAQLEAVQKKRKEILNIPVLLGPVGVGKTTIFKELCDELAVPMQKINCGENGDPTEVAGMAVPWALRKEGDEDYMKWVLNETMHRACQEPVMLFFDDIDKMQGIVEGALIGIFGERVARHRVLHPETVIVGAGNRVSDDRLAYTLSESLRTRATIIEVETTLQDFVAFAEDNPGTVNPAILGYLAFKPQHLHQVRDDALRFPTPRGYVEASMQMEEKKPTEGYPGRKPAWKTIVGLKCGDHIGNDFWAWYTVVGKIDVEKLLTTGVLEHGLTGADATMANYAAIFAAAQTLNNKGLLPKYVKGFGTFVKELAPEHRVATFMQLNKKIKNAVSDKDKVTADLLLADLVRPELALP